MVLLWIDTGGIQMIDFEEELKKFQPSLEVEEAEDAIYSRDLSDMTDILLEMMKEKHIILIYKYEKKQVYLTTYLLQHFI